MSFRSNGQRPRLAFMAALAALALVAAVGVALALAGWPGEPDACTRPDGNCYCEAVAATPSESLVKQPANTWSNIAPIVVGLAMVAFGRLGRTRPAVPDGALGKRSGAIAGGWASDAYGLLVVGLGVGSMAFHGSLTRVGGWLDTLSMIAFIAFVLIYDIARIRRRDGDPWWVLVALALTVAVLGLGTWEVEGSGTTVFTVLLVTTAFLETAIALRGVGGIRRPAWPWLVAAFLTFGIATVIWRLSWSDGWLCDPSSLLQGHALWHVLAEAVVPILLLQHLRQPDAVEA